MVPLVDLIWNAPPSCPPRDTVLAEVARVLEGAHEPPLRTRVRADVTEEPGGRYRAEVTIDAGEGDDRRQLEAETCDAIASAAAVIIAVAVDSEVVLPPAGPPPTPIVVPKAAPPSSPPTPAPTRAPASPSTSGPRATSHLELGLAGVVDDFALPSPAPGAEVTLGWMHAWSTWRLRLVATGSYLPSQSATLRDRAEGGQFVGVTAGAGACLALVGGAFDVGPCLGADLELVTGRGVGPLASFRSLSQTGVWSAASGSVLVSWSFAPSIALFARADALRANGPPTFVVQPSDIAVLRPPEWGRRWTLGLALRIF